VDQGDSSPGAQGCPVPEIRASMFPVGRSPAGAGTPAVAWFQAPLRYCSPMGYMASSPGRSWQAPCSPGEVHPLPRRSPAIVAGRSWRGRTGAPRAESVLRGIIVYRNRHQADTGPGALEDLAR